MKLRRRQLLQLSVTAATASLLAACADDGPEVSIDTRCPKGPFGPRSTAEEVTAGLNLQGQTALVTGCNSGLGYETMRVLALRGAHVIGTGRTLEKAAQACSSVQGQTTPLALELSDFRSAVACAQAVRALGVGLDMLNCNAGINTFGDVELIGGIEKMFVVNYLGHFVLVNQLLPLMQAGGSARIVHVGSRSAYTQAPAVGIDFDNLRGEGTVVNLRQQRALRVHSLIAPATIRVANDDLAGFGNDVQHVASAGSRDTETLALTDCEAVDAVVRAEHGAVFLDDRAGIRDFRPARPHDIRVVAARHEADLDAIRLFRNAG